MAEQTVETEYRRIRKEHPYMSAKQAILWARGNLKPTILDWQTFSGRGFASATGKVEGFDISVVADYDQYWSDSVVTETDDDTGIRNPAYNHDDYYRRHKKFLSLESDSTVRELATYYHKAGESRNVAWEDARTSLQKEAEDYLGDDYVRLIITVKASRLGIELGSASISSDYIIDWRDIERELDSTVYEHGLVDEAIEEAKENLESLKQTA